MSQEGRELVFVYGTLKRGGSNHACLIGQKFIGPAQTIAGYRLISLGDYPGIISDQTRTTGVTGEVWSVDDRCLQQLDELEGLPEGLFRREAVPLSPPFNEDVVLTYIYARDVSGRAPIPEGVWREPHAK